MGNVSIIKEAKDYVVVKMPKSLATGLGFKKHLSKEDILRVTKEATKLARKNKLPILRSLRDLR